MAESLCHDDTKIHIDNKVQLRSNYLASAGDRKVWLAEVCLHVSRVCARVRLGAECRAFFREGGN